VKAHVLVAFLGYALQVTLKHLPEAEWLRVFAGASTETAGGDR